MKEWKKGKKGKKLWEGVAPEDKERMKKCFQKMKNEWKRNSTKDLMPSLEKSFLKLLFKSLKFSKKMMSHLKLLLL